MSQTTSSTIELTTKDNQNHRSKVISKGKRSPQRVSSRPRSAKERKDALEKIKLFRKRNKKHNKKFANKIIYIKEKKAEKTSTIKTSSTKTLSKHQKKANEKTDTKTKTSSDLKPAKEQATETELESTTSNLNYIHEENTADQNDTATNTNSLSAIFTDDVPLPKTSTTNEKKYQPTLTNNDCPTTEDIFAETENNNNKNETSTKTDTLTFTCSTDTDTTVMTSNPDFITVTSELNESNTEDIDEELVKDKCTCKWYSIISVIGGFILLCTVYYFGTSFLEEKCKQDVDFYVNNLSIEITSVSVEKYFESFDEKNADTKCKWLRKTMVKVALEEKFKEKLRTNIDDFFKNYEKQMAEQYQMEQKETPNLSKLHFEFLKMQKCYKTSKYYQEKKSHLEEKKELIPVSIKVSGFQENLDLNETYDLLKFSQTTYKPIYVSHNQSGTLYLHQTTAGWCIKLGKNQVVEWKNTTDVLHPGKLGTQNPITSDGKVCHNIKITTQMFFSKNYF